MWFAVEASSQKSNVAFGIPSVSSVGYHFFESSLAHSIDVSALVKGVPHRVAHRCHSVIAHHSREVREDGYYPRRGPLVESVSVTAHPTVCCSTLAVPFQNSRIRTNALSSSLMQTHCHSLNLPPNHRLVATGVSVSPSSCVGAPALQPKRYASTERISYANI